ncbi:MerR family transcriptional regulator [Candidatus Falkowbacteria bacterium]|uniref:MerR family transcriptional regulator n=1 Tax=Candidatus Buchananbacteria bacterium CG10_big_fil_rev_8_21_14_0_10_33_19 TaxID=1974525 RepID=A0A2H0W518_9BACT|nr:MerR family transcriptional regulator [Candidatus Falkowbacteria bacterium]PIS06394.1 MAG: MerR family transcriptional regulator [Candidatus Buchananbacteria bacterium CG10_big_fil_rev_8_21_14_0_10_33_19]
MSYNIKQLSELAGVSIRTLHYYDQIDLLNPSRSQNGYRHYNDNDLLILQQILFFRELEFSLAEIKKIIFAPNFNRTLALTDQKKMMKIKRDRLDLLIETIDKTIKKNSNQKNMADEDLYAGLNKAELEAYAKEAQEHWGDSNAYRQSQFRVKKMGKDGLKKVLADSDKLNQQIANEMTLKRNPASPEVQALIAQHYNNLRAFYEPNLTMYRGLAQMYVGDKRFKSYYDQIADGLAQFMCEAMNIYCDK